MDIPRKNNENMMGAPPIALILFSNDLDRFLPMVERERKMIEEALEHFNDTNRLKVIARSSVSVEELFRLFNRYKGRIVLFHFAGHAGGTGLEFNKDFQDTELGRAVGLAELFRREASEAALQLVFLNGCATEPQIALLRKAGVPSIIATQHPVDDERAFHFARQFYRTLANTDREFPFEAVPTVEEAFTHARNYLMALHEMEVKPVARGIKLNFKGDDQEAGWLLDSTNLSWRLPSEIAKENKPFNEQLTLHLIQAIEPYSKPAGKFIARARSIPGWESINRISDKAKDIISYSFVGILGVQLRKLFAIGKEPLSEKKQRKYLSNCLLTGKRTMQLLCFAMISKLWDFQSRDPVKLTEPQRLSLKNLFEDEFEYDLQKYLELLDVLCTIFSDHALEFPLPELKGLLPHLDSESEFQLACARLQEIRVRLDSSQFSLSDCFVAERKLAIILSALGFLADYHMISIKSIDYDEMRNSPPRYLHKYTALGIDSRRNLNTERVNYVDGPINTDAVLLFKGRYKNSINLFPFIIDYNALTFEGSAKVCFYSFQDIADDSLNYRFIEDDSVVNISFTNTYIDKNRDEVNQLMKDPEKRKDYKLDFVFLQLHEAKNTILQLAEEEEDFFEENPDELDF